MAAGRWLEAAIGPWFEHETGLYVAGEQTWCTHPDHPHHRCTVDGFVFEGPGERGFREALGLEETKVTGPGKRWDEIPAHYQAQGQWQMYVTGLERVWFAVLMGRRLDIHELERDQADIDFMVERADEFWQWHVLAGKPPDTDGSDATLRALGAVYPTETPGERSELVTADVTMWALAKAEKRIAVDREKEAKAAILAQLGAAEVGTVDGDPVVTARSQTRTTRCAACGHTTESDPFRVLRPVKHKENT